MTEISVIEAVRATLGEVMEEDERVVLLGEDVGRLGGVFRASDGLLERFGDQRVIDTPMAELSIVGIAIGMALRGLRPIAEIQFADFIYAAMDQIASEAAKYRFRSAGEWTVPLVIRAPWGAGIHGALYHSQSIEAVFSHFPGLKVVAASTPADASGLLRAAVADPDPVIVLEHKLTYRSVRGDGGAPGEIVPIGKARVAREGNHVTVAAYGWMVHESLRAADALASDGGPDLEVLDLRTLFPLDADALVASVEKTGRLCVVHEDVRTLGLGAEVAALVQERAWAHLRSPVARVTMPDVAGIPFADELEAALIPDSESIAAAVRELAASSRRRPVAGTAPAPVRQRSSAYAAVPQASMVVEVDLGHGVPDEDADLLPVVASAFADALAGEAELNAIWTDEGIVRQEGVNLRIVRPGPDGGSAASTVEAAETLTPRGIAAAARNAATSGPGEAAYTVLWPGPGTAFGIPHIPAGQTGVLQFGSPHSVAVAEPGRIDVRRQLLLALSADHRLVDGAAAARLLAGVRARLGSS